MSCLGVPPTRDQQNSPPPFQRLQSVKKMSCFIFVCLRSVHSLLSLRFGGRSSYLTTRPPFTTLRSGRFSHLSTARHKWLLHSTPQIHAVIPFRLTAVIHAQIYPHTQTASKLHFIPPTHCFVPFSRHPYPFPTHLQWYIFSNCDVSTPLSTFQVER